MQTAKAPLSDALDLSSETTTLHPPRFRERGKNTHRLRHQKYSGVNRTSRPGTGSDDRDPIASATTAFALLSTPLILIFLVFLVASAPNALDDSSLTGTPALCLASPPVWTTSARPEARNFFVPAPLSPKASPILKIKTPIALATQVCCTTSPAFPFHCFLLCIPNLSPASSFHSSAADLLSSATAIHSQAAQLAPARTSRPFPTAFSELHPCRAARSSPRRTQRDGGSTTTTTTDNCHSFTIIIGSAVRTDCSEKQARRRRSTARLLPHRQQQPTYRCRRRRTHPRLEAAKAVTAAAPRPRQTRQFFCPRLPRPLPCPTRHPSPRSPYRRADRARPRRRRYPRSSSTAAAARPPAAGPNHSRPYPAPELRSPGC